MPSQVSPLLQVTLRFGCIDRKSSLESGNHLWLIFPFSVDASTSAMTFKLESMSKKVRPRQASWSHFKYSYTQSIPSGKSTRNLIPRRTSTLRVISSLVLLQLYRRADFLNTLDFSSVLARQIEIKVPLARPLFSRVCRRCFPKYDNCDWCILSEARDQTTGTPTNQCNHISWLKLLHGLIFLSRKWSHQGTNIFLHDDIARDDG